jgi:hypothetical protein
MTKFPAKMLAKLFWQSELKHFLFLFVEETKINNK